MLDGLAVACRNDVQSLEEDQSSPHLSVFAMVRKKRHLCAAALMPGYIFRDNGQNMLRLYDDMIRPRTLHVLRGKPPTSPSIDE